MRTARINVCKFSELNAKSKEHAKYKYASEEGYQWSTEAMASITALANHFDGSIKDWSVDFFESSYSSMSFNMPDDMSKKEIRERLKGLGTYNRTTLTGNGDCKLTGMALDEDAIDGFRIAFIRGKETDLEKLMQAAFKTWLKACQDDCAYQYTDEAFGEHCDANEYEFTEDGEMF